MMPKWMIIIYRNYLWANIGIEQSVIGNTIRLTMSKKLSKVTPDGYGYPSSFSVDIDTNTGDVEAKWELSK